MSSVMMNTLVIKKRDSGAPTITSEIRGMTFTRSLLDIKASLNILIVAIFYCLHVGDLLSGWIGEEISWHSRRHDR